MPSQYQPQIFGWIGDLDKGPRLVPLHDRRLRKVHINFSVFLFVAGLAG
ncbi:hypothetical protein [Gilliamella mensalis]|nr:hypothetical protein [Gilliamella mensalis]